MKPSRNRRDVCNFASNHETLSLPTYFTSVLVRIPIQRIVFDLPSAQGRLEVLEHLESPQDLLLDMASSSEPTRSTLIKIWPPRRPPLLSGCPRLFHSSLAYCRRSLFDRRNNSRRSKLKVLQLTQPFLLENALPLLGRLKLGSNLAEFNLQQKRP